MTSNLVLIAAVARNGVIGADGDMPWHLPEDLRHFKKTTQGHAVIMGRKTFESCGALPGRTNIVLSRDPEVRLPTGVVLSTSFAEAENVARLTTGEDRVFVVGGAQIYKAALEFGASEQILSEVHLDAEGDTLYPAFDRAVWSEHSREPRDGFDIVRWRR